MNALQRRVTLAICLIVGLSLLMAAGLTFLVAPMSESLDLSDEVVENLLAIPSVASLLVVFSAGQLGDRLGQRRALVFAAIVFIVGAGTLASAQGAVAVEIGLALCAAAAITMQIVGVSLLQRTTVDGPAQVSAFTTYGMIFPVAFLVLPVVTAGVLGLANWRVVPVIWMAAGLLILALSMALLERQPGVPSRGEWLTPIFAGIALAGIAHVLSELGHIRTDVRAVVVGFTVFAVAAVLCAIVYRRSSVPSLSFAPIQGAMLRPLLVGVGLASLVGLLTFISVALEYFYDLTPFEASLAVIPAQLGSILGAKLVATWAIRRWGGVRAGRYLMAVIAVAMLPLIFVQVGSPAWYVVGTASLFSAAGMAALTVLNTEVMRRAPRESTGAVSSFRTAASSIGAALGVGLFGTIIISSVQVDAGESDVSAAQLVQLAASLRLVGVLASAVALTGFALLTFADRRSRGQEAELAR